ncbi:hypothetical protein [Halobacterium wangiae]|uniref:hypothetical protein n=1 Tax=Halobacterium wangiae TaxID=2902623 RepID=UPI001E3DC8D4|nr:hypothetical protein [Halobacterium wangiae]
MPSRRLAAVLAAMVLLSGCSMLPGGGGEQTTTLDSPDRHELVFASETGGHEYEATVTVERDGEQLLSETVASDGDGLYAELATFDEPGPYTVTVDTTLPDAGGENERVQFETDGDLGNATAVHLDYQDVEHATFELPRRDLEHELGVQSDHTSIDGPQPTEVHFRVEHRGEQVATETTTVQGSELTRSVDLAETGVYNVAVRIDDTWANDTVVVTTPAQHVAVTVNDHGDDATIEVQQPFQWN